MIHAVIYAFVMRMTLRIVAITRGAVALDRTHDGAADSPRSMAVGGRTRRVRVYGQ